MKLYYITWRNCINNKMYVIVNANSPEERDEKFSKWRNENPSIAPMAYSPRSVEVKDCVFLNDQH